MGFYHVQETRKYEYLYRCANLAEANWLMGSEVGFQSCNNYVRDIASDVHPTWDPKVNINIIFDDNPKSTLRKIGWLAEDEQLPYLVYISNIIYPKFDSFKRSRPKDISTKDHFATVYNPDGSPSSSNTFHLNVTRFSKVTVPYTLVVDGDQDFIITDLQGDSINPFIWMCKLAPYRDQVDLNKETPKVENKLEDNAVTGNSFLKNNRFK